MDTEVESKRLPAIIRYMYLLLATRWVDSARAKETVLYRYVADLCPSYTSKIMVDVTSETARALHAIPNPCGLPRITLLTSWLDQNAAVEDHPCTFRVDDNN